MASPKQASPLTSTDLLARLLDAAPQFWGCRELSGLGTSVLRLLEEVVPVAWIAVWLSGPDGTMPSHWAVEINRGDLMMPSALPPDPSVWQKILPEDGWVAKDLRQCEHPSPNLVWFLERGMRSVLLMPLSTPEGLIGGLAMACRKPGAFAPLGQRFPPHMARFLSPLVDRIRQKLLPDHRSERLSRECSHQRIVLDVNNHLARHLEPRALFQAISEHLRAHFSYDSLNLLLLDEASGEASIRFVDFPTGRGFMQENQRITHGDGPAMRAIRERRPLLSERKDLIQSDPGLVQALVEGEGLQTTCCIPLISRNRALGSLNFGSRDERAFSQQDVDLLCAVANQVAIALDNAFAYEQIQQLKDRLTEEKLYLEEEVREEFAFGEVIGHSPSLQKVLRQIQTVATSDATVLLLGETGTGKELMARALHTLSSRKDHTFVKLNCAAIPLGLVESELFGHERGAFTGAIAQKTGRMELAHQGTLFLDEVGEMPLDLQTKLLRAIQEREFERLGGTRTHKVDVRLIAATNRDLAAMVQEGTFRSDLYYRLKVFPIQMPPLRERKDDIPLLVSYFTQKYAQRMKRHIESIPARAMDAMVAWPWPGNVRELENFLERCVILTRGQELYVPISELRQPDGSSTEESPLASLQDAEREHILRALRESNGKVGGADGAAARLGMKRTTLQSRMLKLGIPTPAIKPTFRQ